jgi:hypothetical protein
MKIRFALLFLWLTLSAAGAWTQEGPNRPEPKPLTLDSKSTAILVLDLNARCDDPKQVCSKITAPLGDFLDKARAAAVPIIYSVSATAKGKPIGELAAPLRRKESETVIYPDAFDKFYGGELQAFLKDKGAKTLIITGSATNNAVLYTATTAARMHRYGCRNPHGRRERQLALRTGIRHSPIYRLAVGGEQVVSIHQSVDDQLSPATLRESGALKKFPSFQRLHRCLG